MGQSMRTEGIRRYYIFQQFRTEKCIQEDFSRDMWGAVLRESICRSSSSASFLKLIFLRKQLKQFSFPASHFSVLSPHQRRMCLCLSFILLCSSSPWCVKTSRQPNNLGVNKALFNQGTTVVFMSFSDLHIFPLGQNMALGMDSLVLLGYSTHTHTHTHCTVEQWVFKFNYITHSKS